MTKKGWKIVYEKNLPVDFQADVAEGQVCKEGTAEGTAAIAGAGDVPIGVAYRTIDISADGARGELVTDQLAPILCAAAITDVTIPVKVAAGGTCTPCTANNDVILGRPKHLQATVGGEVQVDLSTMGTYYGSV